MSYFLTVYFYFFFFKQKTAYEMRISDWSSDVCSSDLHTSLHVRTVKRAIDNGMLAVQIIDGRQYVSRTDATLWLSRKCPTGENVKSWIALQTAANLYLFTVSELEDYIADKTRIGRAHV